MTSEQKQDVLRLISNGQLDHAIAALLNRAANEDDRAEAYALSARLKEIERQERFGTIESNEARLERNKIVYALIALVGDVDDKYGEELLQNYSTANRKGTGKSGVIGTISLFLGILASIATVLAFVFDVFQCNPPPPPPSSAQVIVYLHGPKGKQDIMLENQGSLVLSLGDWQKEAPIGEHGKAVFEDIEESVLDSTVKFELRAEGFELVDLDSRMRFQDEPLYLEMKSTSKPPVEGEEPRRPSASMTENGPDPERERTSGEATGTKKVEGEEIEPFRIGTYEVTVKEYLDYCRKTGTVFPEEVDTINLNHPITYVSWNDAVKYCTYINARLPTVEEWELAASGGSVSKGYDYSGSNNPKEVAWFGSEASGTKPVGKNKAPNELGIYDMSGNVQEWCADTIHSGRKIMYIAKGGGWKSYTQDMKIKSVNPLRADFKNDATGFRVIMMPDH